MMNREKPGYELISIYRSELMGFAILLIMFCHLDTAQTHNGIEVSALARILHTFTVGVDIFMFLSGFGLYYSYSKRKPTYFSFLKARLSRVLPLYCEIAGITYLIYDLLINRLSFWSFLKDFSFLSWLLYGTTRYWFVLAICGFYCLFPLLYRFIHGGKYGFAKMLVFSLLWWVVIGYGSVRFTLVSMFKMPLDRLPIFMFGIYCGKLSKEKNKLSCAALSFFALFGYLMFFLMKTSALRSLSFVLYYPVRAFLGLSIITTILAILEILRGQATGAFRVITASLKWLGGLTLECYLFHQSYMILCEFPYQLPLYLLVAVILPVASAALVFWIRSYCRKEKHS